MKIDKVELENFLELHPQDQMNYFNELDEDEKLSLVYMLADDVLADFFEHLEIEDVIKMFVKIKDSKVVSIINNMDSDEVAQIFRKFDDTTKNFYLNLVDSEKSDLISHLLTYDDSEAGSLMEKKFLYIKEKKTVKEAQQILIEQAHDIGNISYLYILDNERKLIGVISLKELILSDTNMKITDIMITNIISVKDSDDKQYAAMVVKDYDFYAVPVINDKGQMQGIITEDDVIDILLEDAHENLKQLSGVNEIKNNEGLLKSILSRSPWMIILLVFTIINSLIYSRYDNVLTISAVSAMMPLIASISGNVGVQVLGITIYRISNIHNESIMDIIKYILGEMKIYFFISIVLNVILFIILFFILKYQSLAYIAIITFTLTFLSSSLFGSLIPILLDKMKINTSIASGPLISTVNDLVSISIYLTVATIIMM